MNETTFIPLDDAVKGVVDKLTKRLAEGEGIAAVDRITGQGDAILLAEAADLLCKMRVRLDAQNEVIAQSKDLIERLMKRAGSAR